MLKPLFYRRDFSLNPFQAEWLNVERARWAAVGGCDTARLSGDSQGRLDLARALGLLRCGIELVDESGQACWWGYVARIELWAGLVGAICDLDEMTNRVKVSYTRLDFHAAAGGVKDATAWAEDLNSQGIYGVKEKIIRLQGSTSAQATAAGAIALSRFAYPIARPALATSGAAGPDVVILLKGWWHSLAWRTYSQAAGIIEHVVEKPGMRNLGGGAPQDKEGQSFTVTVGGWQAKTIWVRCCKIGAPADNMRLDIYTNNGSEPGASLVNMTKAASEISLQSYSWTAFEFPNPITMSAGIYWAVFSRTGAYSGTDYYRLMVDNTASYAGGGFLYYSAALGTWQLGGMPECDLMFRVVGGMETTKQIELMAATGCGGQFLSGVSIETASGLYTNPFRNGEKDALDEVAAQLQAGTVSSTRLLAEVTHERLLRIFAAPAAAAAVNHIDATGHLVDRNGAVLPAWVPAVGRWAVLDSPWLGAGGENLHITDRVFLEAVEYDKDFGRLQPG